ncbi:hypothetical protein PENVUL_c009G09507 [Penicillium vulpinum]|uniref:Uncharacterized protein n=1 Tax=Penicillium vulpinum TaxID=29845 RepID=A0A1V6S3Y8_9EURO|nr:hypothetical protein PENVUL_c009G09507 [Penicillium vulpinum]
MLHYLGSYLVNIRNISQIDYRDFKASSTMVPSSGIVAMNILKILSTYDNFLALHNLNLDFHRMDEAIRLDYRESAYLGDPLLVEGMSQYQDMLKQSTVDLIYGKISDFHTLKVHSYNLKGIESFDTWSLRIGYLYHRYDQLTFGSQLMMMPETGIILSNEMNEFPISGFSNTFVYILALQLHPAWKTATLIHHIHHSDPPW